MIKNTPTVTTTNNPALPDNFSNADSIDIIDLLESLWGNKKKIMLITAIFIVLGIVLAFVLPKKWTSQAVITTPETRQLVKLRSVLVQLDVLNVNVPVDPNAIYLKFLQRFDSKTLLQTYLQSSEYIVQQLGDDAKDPAILHQAVVSAADNFVMQNNEDSKNKDKNAYSSWSLKFTAPSALEAQDVLGGYIRYVSNEVKHDALEDIRAAVDLEVKHEQNKLKLDIANLTRDHENKLKRLQYSLEVANAAGIKKPVYSNGQAVKDDPDYSVVLGSEGIEKKLDIERTLDDVTKMNTDLQNRQFRLKQLQDIKIEDVDFSPFNYQMNPSLPVRSDGLGRGLIVVLMALFGIILSSGYVLISSAFKKHNHQ